MQAGKLRHRVRIDSPAFAQDATSGAMTPDWTLLANVWGSIEPLSARDFVAAQAVQSKVSARIVIRYRSDIVAGMRAVHDGMAYLIEGVLRDADSGRDYLTLVVSEGTKIE